MEISRKSELRNTECFVRGGLHVGFRTQCVIMTLVGGSVIANDVLKMGNIIDFQSSWIVIHYKIHFRVLLQAIYGGEVSVGIVIDK